MAKSIGTRIAKRDKAIIEDLVTKGYYINVGDFVRTAVRDELRRMREKENE